MWKCLGVVLLLQSVCSVEQKYKKLLLELHNDARGNEGASDMNELVWDDQLEKEAQAWADRCVFEHEMKERGENLAFDSNKKPETELIKSSFQAWFDEKNQYSYGQRSCGSTGACHYTQQVWAKTRRVGCGMKWCNYLTYGTSNAFYLVCFYDPKGNMNGEKPYLKGGACSKCRDDQSCKNKLCSGGEDPCEDLNEQCDLFKQSNQCTQNEAYMKPNCAKACGFCKSRGKPSGGKPKPGGGGGKPKPGGGGGGGAGASCEDKDRRCSTWAQYGQCQRNPGYMKANCKKACKVCGGGGNDNGGGGRGGSKTKPKKKSKCRDKNRSCGRWAKANECTRNPGYMKRNCAKSCKACGDSVDCIDESGGCATWASRGECEINPRWMNIYCQKSCGKCSGSNSGESGSKTKGGSCKDNNGSCGRWASNGECNRNPSYMKKSCKKSCNVC